MPKINEEKYKNVILYLSSKLGGEIRGKKKLAKLLYFVDFDFFEMYEKPMTGELYKSLPMGPFPSNMEDILESLEKTKKIVIKNENTGNGYNPTEVYIAKDKVNVKVFKENEIKILNRVVLKYGHLTGKQLEDLTHSEAPYIGTKPGREIAYELSFYRGTDFTENA